VRIVATVEARMGSTRLPGKTLATILGRPLLELLIERLRRAKKLNQVVVATTTDPSDNAIEQLTCRLGVGCYRGSVEDVLDRVLKAAQAYEADLIVETTGDNPFYDPDTIDELITMFEIGQYDFVSNYLSKTFPLGLGVLLFPTKVLEEVGRLTQDPADRENVSLYIYEHPERYRLGSLDAPDAIRRPQYRLTVDRQEDLDLAREIFGRLYPTNPNFTTQDVVRLLDEHPELARMNAQVIQKAVR